MQTCQFRAVQSNPLWSTTDATPPCPPHPCPWPPVSCVCASVQATPVYRTNDPFTFKINDFKLPSDLVDDIVNKRYPACLAVLITESLELEGLWVPSASPNIKDKVGPYNNLQLESFVSCPRVSSLGGFHFNRA